MLHTLSSSLNPGILYRDVLVLAMAAVFTILHMLLNILSNLEPRHSLSQGNCEH